MTEPKKSVCPKCGKIGICLNDGMCAACWCSVNGEPVSLPITEDDVRRAIKSCAPSLAYVLAGLLSPEPQKPQEKERGCKECINEDGTPAGPPRIEPTEENIARIAERCACSSYYDDAAKLMILEVNKILAEQWEKGRWK